MQTPLQRTLAHFPDAHLEGKEWVALCPAHEDHSPSLNIREGEHGRVVLICRSHRCAPAAILAAVGLTERDLFPAREQRNGYPAERRITAVYDYWSADGTLLYQVVRYDPKGFAQRRPDPRAKDGWTWDLSGVPRALYQLPELVAADLAAIVYVVEGEQDANRLAALGLVATTNAGGAKKWRPEYNETLRGRHVVILPDNDVVGREHAQHVAQQLHGVAASVKIVDLPGLPEKGDASDWLDAGGTAEALIALGAAAPAWQPSAPVSTLPFLTAREIAAQTPEEPAFVAKPWAACGAITEVDGKLKASGKTTLLTHIVRCVLRGEPFLHEPTAQSPVVYLTEQPKTTFREALRRADLLEADDLHVLCWPDLRKLGRSWEDTATEAVAFAQRVGARLLVVDTLPQFSGVTGDSENSAGEGLRAMAPLQMAAAADLAVMVARHERKGGGEVGESGRGSSAYSAAVDTIISLRRPQGDAEAAAAVRVLSCLSRFDEVPETLVVELTADGYVVRGDAVAYARATAERVIPTALPTEETKAKTADALADTTKTSRTLAHDVLKALHANGLAERTGAGKKGDPYRYWRWSDGAADSSVPSKKEVADETNGGALTPIQPTIPATELSGASATPVVVDESAASTGGVARIHSSATSISIGDERNGAGAAPEEVGEWEG